MSHPVFEAWWEHYVKKHHRGQRKAAAWAAWQLCYAHAAECAKTTATKEVLLEIETAVMNRIRMPNAPAHLPPASGGKVPPVVGLSESKGD